jgi:hypothetical protein
MRSNKNNKMSGFTVDEFVYLLSWEPALLVLILNETFSSEILLVTMKVTFFKV